MPPDADVHGLSFRVWEQLDLDVFVEGHFGTSIVWLNKEMRR
jgi:hypothetical protein